MCDFSAGVYRPTAGKNKVEMVQRGGCGVVREQCAARQWPACALRFCLSSCMHSPCTCRARVCAACMPHVRVRVHAACAPHVRLHSVCMSEQLSRHRHNACAPVRSMHVVCVPHAWLHARVHVRGYMRGCACDSVHARMCMRGCACKGVHARVCVRLHSCCKSTTQDTSLPIALRKKKCAAASDACVPSSQQTASAVSCFPNLFPTYDRKFTLASPTSTALLESYACLPDSRQRRLPPRSPMYDPYA
eukprot:362573-Chlamydomonas_euryale.AAC.8